MKIQQRDSGGLYSAPVGPPQARVSAAGDHAQAVRQQDVVDCALAGESTQRGQQIDRLRETFQAGAYQVDSVAVSRAVIREALAEGGSGMPL